MSILKYIQKETDMQLIVSLYKKGREEINLEPILSREILIKFQSGFYTFYKIIMQYIFLHHF